MMLSKFIAKKNFYFTFFEQRLVPACYKELTYQNFKIPDLIAIGSGKLNLNTPVLFIELFPSYFIPRIEIPSGFDLKKIFRVKGFCININNLEDIDRYILANFKPNNRTSLRRRLKGLETSFDVRYEIFYGNITKKEYSFLMEALHKMLTRRFNQRDDTNIPLQKWDYYLSSVFDLINQKKASLYVIYDDEKPIQISLSYHYEKIVFLSIPSYDIDYAKFGLGNIAVHKLLEWCISNGYEILDMGYGAFDYKLKWCNHTYNFEHHIFYKSKSTISYLVVGLITLKTRVINYLLTKNVNVFYHQLKSLFSKKNDQVDFEYIIIPNNDKSKAHIKMESIDFLCNEKFSFLKKSVYDFLYTSKEHVADVKVYKINTHDTYLIKGLHNSQHIQYKIQ